MAKDLFTLQSEKARIIPYFPLICFPDHTNNDYKIYQQQKRTNDYLIPKMLSSNKCNAKTVKKLKTKPFVVDFNTNNMMA